LGQRAAARDANQHHPGGLTATSPQRLERPIQATHLAFPSPADRSATDDEPPPGEAVVGWIMSLSRRHPARHTARPATDSNPYRR
jgi:hypothetical protein